MTLFLSKLVPIFLFPLGLALLLALIALVLARFRRLSRGALLLAILLLWLPAMPVTANLLALAWEAAYPPVAAADQPQADAIVLLGGSVAQPLPPRVDPDVDASADRLFEAARLFHAGKAAHIIPTGGNLPWEPRAAPQAKLIAELLAEFGIPAEAIVLQPHSRNTYEDAVYTAKVLSDRGWHSVLLVTSASHMRRAMAIFRRAGIAATAATADVNGGYPLYSSVLDFLPSADALAESSNVIKEMIGLLYYRLRGWA